MSRGSPPPITRRVRAATNADSTMTLRLTTLSLVALLKYGYWQDSTDAPFVGDT